MEVPRLGVEIGAIVTGLHKSHSNAGSEPRLQPTPQFMATPIFTPLSKARDRTLNLMVPTQIRFCCAMMGTPRILYPAKFSFKFECEIKLRHQKVCYTKTLLTELHEHMRK